jgi:hypothetical protein
MDSQLDQTPGLGLPQPTTGFDYPDAGQSSVGAVQVGPPANVDPTPLLPPAPAPANLSVPTGLPPRPTIDKQGAVVSPERNNGSAALQLDDDGTVVDQEWIDKAKDAIAGTRTDPFLQTRELNEIKAQYIKARYNKDVKIIED